MKLSPIEIVYIGGVFTIVGALIGGLVGFYSAKHSTIHADKLKAAANLRAAFAPEIAKMKELNPEIQGGVIDKLLHAAFDRQAIAIETFSFYLCPDQKKKYYEAWNTYSKVYGDKRFSAYCTGDSPKELFEDRIKKILKFTEKI